MFTARKCLLSCGLVTNARTGAPLSGASIQVNGSSTAADPNGAYRLEGLEVTEAVGSASAQGFVPTVGVTIAATTDPGPPPSWQAIATHDKTAKTCSITTSGPSIWEISCP